jgi:hypothetical protein
MNNFFSLLLLIILVIISCQQTNSGNTFEPYIISKNDSIEKAKYTENEPPPPPRGFYSRYNIILSRTGKFYYYELDISKYSDNINDEIPVFINLRPESVVILDDKYLDSFLNDNIPFEKRQYLMISSVGDTVEKSVLDRLIYNLNREQGKISYSVRRATDEELKVIKAKSQNNEVYP